MNPEEIKMVQRLQNEARSLRGEIDRLQALLSPPVKARPEPVCSKCDKPRSQADYLTDIRVVTCEGEEGYSDVTMLLCEEHAADVVNALYALGFRDHAHGGTALLQDEDCPGGKYNEQHLLNPCPTPTDPYKGTYIVGNYAISSGRNSLEEGDDHDDGE